jgi:hypothetical protein
MQDLLDEIESLIIDITPQVSAGLKFKLAPKNAQIEAMIDNGASTSRSFQVRYGELTGTGYFNCTDYNVKAELIVVLRYYICSQNAYLEANTMSCSDAVSIVQAIIRPPNGTFESDFVSIEYVGDSGLIAADDIDEAQENIYFRALTFEVEF